jgi:sugar lactone lactonase YvrE
MIELVTLLRTEITIARISFSRFVALVTTGLVLAACGRERTAADTTAGHTAAAASTGPEISIPGFDVPESVRYDAELDVFYVSNINGNPSQKDNNGWIALVRLDSPIVINRLVEGGKAGATLNAPKGMALKGDTLFVTDIDAVRMFNRRTGASLGSVSFAAQNAGFLNDVAVGPDGLYITDSGISFDAQGNMSTTGTDRIFRMAGRTVTVAARGDSLARPNGIAWDATGNRFVLAPFGGPALQSWTPGAQHPTVMVTGPGQYDGVEVLANGNILVSSWADSTVHVVHGGSHMMAAIRNVSAPADIGVDTKRNLVAIPRFTEGKVEFYRIP